MFIETSSPRRNGDKARFESEEFQPTGSSGRCLKFWYHMYGSSIGRLNVWMSSNGSTGQIWTLSGDQRNKWFYAQAPVRSTDVYQVCRRLKPTIRHQSKQTTKKIRMAGNFLKTRMKRKFFFVHEINVLFTLLSWSTF